MQQAREVAIVGLQHVDKVWGDMGCCGASVVCGSYNTGTSAAVWGFLLSPNSSPGPFGDSFVAADCGACGGGLGGTTGGIKCDPEVNLQMLP